MMEPYITAQSLALRGKIAQLIRPLRRVRPKVPFFRLPAHRIPTLWGLYRGLLREAPSENIKWRIRLLFRQRQHMTSTDKTIKYLNRGYKWLDIFTRARKGDDHLQKVLQRYSTMIAAKRQNAYYSQLLDKELAFQQKLRNRPIVTGGLLRPTLYHGPLPRLKPQPVHITGMIISRKKARTKRQARQAVLREVVQDLRAEREFEIGLNKLVKGRMETFYSNNTDWKEWMAPIQQVSQDMQAPFEREAARAQSWYSPELLESIIEARRNKIANKTREKERERRGEVLRRTIKRRQQGPPAHILSFLTPEQRHLDRVVRSVSEVGYVGMIKKMKGFKLKDPDLGEQLEAGKEENRPALDDALKDIRAEMERRQHSN